MCKCVAVDFDKTLTTGEGPGWWREDETEYPDEEMIEWVNHQYASGHKVIIWTARPWSEAATVASYLTKWQVRWHGLRCGKGSADLYVDDKAMTPEDAKNAPKTVGKD